MDLAALERNLAEAWQALSPSEEAPAVRACSHNLVIVCRDREDLLPATETVVSLSEVHPGRALVVVPSPHEANGLSAHVAIHCHRGPGDRLVCCEQINLDAGGDGVSWLPSALLQMLVGDCPVYTWWRRPMPADDPLWVSLARLSRRFVTDSALSPAPGETLGGLRRIVGEGFRVGDLQWIRLRPWLELVASQFDAPVAWPYLRKITALEIRAGDGNAGGLTVAGAYIAGWLAGRLGWEIPAPGTIRRREGAEIALRSTVESGGVPGEPSTIRIHCEDGHPPAVFEIGRAEGPRPRVQLKMKVEGACPLPCVCRLDRVADSMLLCGELERIGRDPLFLNTLDSAVRLLG